MKIIGGISNLYSYIPHSLLTRCLRRLHYSNLLFYLHTSLNPKIHNTWQLFSHHPNCREVPRRDRSIRIEMTEFTNSECEGLIGHNVVLGLAGFFGISANLILLGFSLKHGCSGLSPDKLLITNFAVADLIALMLSLPLHVRAINGSSDLEDNNSEFEIERLQYCL